jgi:hypothetical protein
VWIIDELDAEEGTVELRSNDPTIVGRGIPAEEALNLIEDRIPELFYRGNWYFTFEGGCITYEFDAKGTLAETVAADADDALGFYPAFELRKSAPRHFGSMSETEYVEDLNALVATARSNFEASVAAYEQIADPTMAEFVARVDREIAINSEFRQGFEALDPPDSIADVHRIIDDLLDRGLSAAEGLVAVADTVSSLEEAEQTPEFAEYRAADADIDRICLDIQRKLDDLATRRDVVIDAPWIPDLRLTVRAALGCGALGTG